MRKHVGGGSNFWLAELLLAVSGAGWASKAAGQTSAERSQMVCHHRDRADESGPELAGQGHSHRGKANSGNEPEAKGKRASVDNCLGLDWAYPIDLRVSNARLELNGTPGKRRSRNLRGLLNRGLQCHIFG